MLDTIIIGILRVKSKLISNMTLTLRNLTSYIGMVRALGIIDMLLSGLTCDSSEKYQNWKLNL